MGARGWLRVNRVGINFRLNIRGRVLALGHHPDQEGSSLLNLMLLAGTLSAVWFVILMNIVSMGEAKETDRSDLAAISSADGSLDVADSAVEAIAADISGATWIDLPDGALGLSAMTLSRDDQFRGRALAETVRYEVALGVLERTSGSSKDIVMSGVRSVLFSRSGERVTTSLEIVSESGTPQTVEFTTLLASF